MSDSQPGESSDIDVVKAIQQQEQYFLALGRFTNAFAQVESSLKSFFAELLKIDAHTANAAFGGQRMKPTMDAIRRLHERRNIDLDDLYAPVANQLGQILRARDGIIHWGARNIDNADAIVTNARYAHVESAVRSFPISPEILDRMTDDAESIDHRLQLATLRSKIGNNSFVDLFGEIEQPTWRYSHQPQPNRLTKRP